MRRALTIAGLALALCGAASGGRAETFTSAQFLEWPRESQAFYFRTAIGMAGLVAGQNDDSQGRCIENWFFKNQSAAHEDIIGVMRTYPTFHPRGVILAVLEKRCGKLIFQ